MGLGEVGCGGLDWMRQSEEVDGVSRRCERRAPDASEGPPLPTRFPVVDTGTRTLRACCCCRFILESAADESEPSASASNSVAARVEPAPAPAPACCTFVMAAAPVAPMPTSPGSSTDAMIATSRTGVMIRWSNGSQRDVSCCCERVTFRIPAPSSTPGVDRRPRLGKWFVGNR